MHREAMRRTRSANESQLRALHSAPRAAAALLAVLVASACCGGVAPPPELEVGDSYPDCGPISGGTSVTVEASHLDLVGVVSLSGNRSGRVEPVPFSVSGEGLVFTTPPWHEGEVVTILARGTAFVRCKVLGRRRFDITATLGSFEYHDAPRLEMHDADHAGEGLNPASYDGNCGGGYWRTIKGEHFTRVPGPSVLWGGELLTEEDGKVSVLDDTTLLVRVPPGPRGDWVSDIRILPIAGPCDRDPLECCGGWSDPPGRFFYRQETCVSLIEHLPELARASFVEPLEASPIYLDVGEVLEGSSSPQEIAVAAASGGDLKVWLYEGDGTGDFERVQETALTGATPSAIVLARLDENAFADAAITLLDRDELAVFWNKGAGYELARSTMYPVGETPVAVVAGDFDGDGDQDLAVANRGGASISFLELVAPGVLDPSSWPPIGLEAAPVSLATANLDGTGGDDLAIAAGGAVVALTSSGDTVHPLRVRESLALVELPHIVTDLAVVQLRALDTDWIAAVTTASPSGLDLVESGPTGLSRGPRVRLIDWSSPPLHVVAGEFDRREGSDLVIARTKLAVELAHADGGSLGSAHSDFLYNLPLGWVSSLAAGWLDTDDGPAMEDLVFGIHSVEGEGHDLLIVVPNPGGETPP